MEFSTRGSGPMYTTLKDRIKLYRLIYEMYVKTPRIKTKRLSKELKLRPSVGSKRVKEAIDDGYIFQPQLRKKSFSNLIEHVYFVKCKDPLKMFEELYENKDVIYHAFMEGFADLWIITKKEIDIDGIIVHYGIRSDYHISYAPDRTWEKAIQIMRKMLRAFKRYAYTPEGIIKDHWDETVIWDEMDETLFREFNYDLRKPYTPLMRKYNISKDKIDQWLEKYPECCTVVTGFFPKTISAYDPYLFMIETDYEDFVIHLFSQLPTCVWFFKVSGKLFVHTWLDRGSMRSTVRRLKDISRLYIRSLLRDLAKKGIIKSEVHATVEGFWRKEIDD